MLLRRSYMLYFSSMYTHLVQCGFSCRHVSFLQNGSLRIIDRKKNIFKGEYIAPEKIEGDLVQSLAVAQVFIHGLSIKSSVVGTVIPDVDSLKSWCASKGVNGEYEELCKDKKVEKLIFDDMISVGRARGLKSFELVSIFICRRMI